MIALIFLVLGVVLGHLGLAAPGEVIDALLCVLVFLAGMEVGTVEFGGVRDSLRRVPLLVAGAVLGSSAAGLLMAPVAGLDPAVAVAAGLGMGWYSLVGPLLAGAVGPGAGLVALLSNMVREVVSIVAYPYASRLAGRWAPIAGAGATSMDTSLPIIVRYGGGEAGRVAVVTGMVVTLLIPIAVQLALVFAGYR